MTTHKQFFGDTERSFKLTPELIRELERTTGAGIGALCRRLFAGEFRHVDVIETVRLALIGGGEAPARAYELCETYVAARPLAEGYALAVAILEAAWFGAAKSDTETPDNEANSNQEADHLSGQGPTQVKVREVMQANPAAVLTIRDIASKVYPGERFRESWRVGLFRIVNRLALELCWAKIKRGHGNRQLFIGPDVDPRHVGLKIQNALDRDMAAARQDRFHHMGELNRRRAELFGALAND